MSKRFSILFDRVKEKGASSVSAGLMSVIAANSKVTRLQLELRAAEQEFEHALRGLEHKDYDYIFEGWR